MTDIVIHKVEDGTIKVLVLFDDGTKEWWSLEEVKEDAEDLLAKYGRKHHLEREGAWVEVGQQVLVQIRKEVNEKSLWVVGVLTTTCISNDTAKTMWLGSSKDGMYCNNNATK